jgi:hypothetical protein
VQKFHRNSFNPFPLLTSLKQNAWAFHLFGALHCSWVATIWFFQLFLPQPLLFLLESYHHRCGNLLHSFDHHLLFHH